jgi:hypothetical protein
MPYNNVCQVIMKTYLLNRFERRGKYRLLLNTIKNNSKGDWKPIMQDIFETIKTRRSIRKYKKEIPDESGLKFKHV